jgi:hypothetical protein
VTGISLGSYQRGIGGSILTIRAVTDISCQRPGLAACISWTAGSFLAG